MSRQWNGKYLLPEAEHFLEENVIKIVDKKCPHCGGPISEKFDVISEINRDSFYDDGPTLRTMRMKDGRFVREIVQCEPWSSGPYSFICLEVSLSENFDVKETLFKWTDKQIEGYL